MPNKPFAVAALLFALAACGVAAVSDQPDEVSSTAQDLAATADGYASCYSSCMKGNNDNSNCSDACRTACRKCYPSDGGSVTPPWDPSIVMTLCLVPACD